MNLSDFDYDLPDELIAQTPTQRRDGSRLLVVQPPGSQRGSGAAPDTLSDTAFTALPAWLRAGDLLVLNDTRVLQARLHARKASGGRVEILIERVTGPLTVLAMMRASHAPRPGTVLTLEGAQATVGARAPAPDGTPGRLVALTFDTPVLPLLERIGRLPLPPYITREPEGADALRYQTVYGCEPGAVAAPTAGLHFDEAMLARLAEQEVERAQVTLHVGAGTFLPVKHEDLDQHRMHAERYTVPASTAEAIERTRARGGRVVAVGTTSLRALESTGGAAGTGDTTLFIRPGFAFRAVDVLLTNFHLPRSTLLMLVSAFCGPEVIRAAYAHAIRNRYRFFSYGDAMLLHRPDTPDSPLPTGPAPARDCPHA